MTSSSEKVMEEVKRELQVGKNPMEKVRIEKVIVHICVKGGDWNKLQKAAKLLEQLTGQKPVLRRAKKTIKAFGISRKQPISAMVTLRKDKAYEFLAKAFEAVDYKIKSSSIDNFGNFAFGIKEHLDIPGTRYDPSIGIFGMDVIVHLSKPGYRVKVRRFCRSKIGKNGIVNKEEAIKFLREIFGVEVIENGKT